MIINEETMALIKEFEGLYLNSYRDPVGVWTIGWGITSADKAITGKEIKKGMKISKATAEKWLKDSLEKKYLPKVMKYGDKYHWNENEAGALVSFAFNIGSIDQLTDNGKRSKAVIADKMLEYNKAGGKVLRGLTLRRQAERKLFLKPVASSIYKGDLPKLPLIRKYFRLGDGYERRKNWKNEIMNVQKLLNWSLERVHGFSKLTVDGMYGKNTVKMVRLYQMTFCIKVNGCFGKKCLSVAKKLIKKADGSVIKQD